MALRDSSYFPNSVASAANDKTINVWYGNKNPDAALESTVFDFNQGILTKDNLAWFFLGTKMPLWRSQ